MCDLEKCRGERRATTSADGSLGVVRDVRHSIRRHLGDVSCDEDREDQRCHLIDRAARTPSEARKRVMSTQLRFSGGRASLLLALFVSNH